MAEGTWTLNDSCPATLGMTFSTPANSGTWTINDSGPTSLSTTTGASASPWNIDKDFYGASTAMHFTTQISLAINTFRMLLGVGL